MEVHHHSRTEKIKWKHYLWEFFMLFLAVFAGFLAENKREHIAESKREKRYMQMLIDDLKNDENEISRIDSARVLRQKRLDSLILLYGEKNTPENLKNIYRLTLQTDGYESFIRNDRTIQELKSAGGMRLLHSEPVSSALMNYDNFIKAEVDWNNNTEASRIDYYKQIRFQLLNAQILNKMARGSAGIQPALINTTPLNINMIAGSLLQVKNISETCRESGIIAREKIHSLIALIKKEYHLK